MQHGMFSAWAGARFFHRSISSWNMVKMNGDVDIGPNKSENLLILRGRPLDLEMFLNSNYSSVCFFLTVFWIKKRRHKISKPNSGKFAPLLPAFRWVHPVGSCPFRPNDLRGARRPSSSRIWHPTESGFGPHFRDKWWGHVCFESSGIKCEVYRHFKYAYIYILHIF